MMLVMLVMMSGWMVDKECGTKNKETKFFSSRYSLQLRTSNLLAYKTMLTGGKIDILRSSMRIELQIFIDWLI